MKVKYYRLKEYLSEKEANEYLSLLTGVYLDPDEFLYLVDELGLPVFTKLRALKPKAKEQSTPRELSVGIYRVKPLSVFFKSPANAEVIQLRYDFNSDAQGVGSLVEGGFIDDVNGEIEALSKSPYQKIKDLFFHLHSIEALAAKMNDELDTQALQSENQRLQQEIEALKAKMERLKAENDDLYGENQHLISEQGRIAYMSEANITPQPNHGLAFTHATKHLELVAMVQQRYYGANFDISNPESHPSKLTITEWLANNHGANKTNADAIERIATPFDRNRAKKE